MEREKPESLVETIHRLMAENKEMVTQIGNRNAKIFELGKKIKELQSWLGTISEPYHKWIKEGCNPQDQGVIFLTWCLLRDYLDSQKPTQETPNHVHSDDSGVFWEGPEGDCPICNPSEKPKEEHGCFGYCYMDGKCIPIKACPICNPQPCTDKLPENMFNTDDGIYHVSRRGTKHFCSVQDCNFCNPPKCEHKNLSGGSDYLKGKRCLDCGEWIGKPLTQCPDCYGAMVVEQMAACPRCQPTHYEYYWFQCPRCNGEGVVPK